MLGMLENNASPTAGRTRGRRASLGLALAVSAALGGGAGAGILAETGALDRTRTTTVIRATPVADTGGSTAAPGVDAEALYAQTSSAVVSIETSGAQSGTGSGFLYRADGHILTAAHVVDGAESVEVTLADGSRHDATVLGSDDATDAAVVKIDPSGAALPTLELGSSSDVAVGEAVAAIGDPFGYERSISTGIVSGLDRSIEAPNGFTVAHAIQTDAAVNPGNSGGPLVDATGRVIGIADQIATGGASKQSAGVGFAIPIDLVAGDLAALEAGDAIPHAYIGVATTTDGGAVVNTVAAGSPAAQAGLRPGDVVTAVGDQPITSSEELVAAIGDLEPADRVAVTYERAGRTQRADVVLASQPRT